MAVLFPSLFADTPTFLSFQFYRELFFDEEGNLLDEKSKDPLEVAMRKKMSESCNKFEDLIQMAKNSEQGMDFLYSSLSNLVDPLQKITLALIVDKQDEYESFLGNKIPTEVNIHPPNDIKSKGRCQRIRKSKDKKVKNKRKCRKCNPVVDHGTRNCQTMSLADIFYLLKGSMVQIK